MNTIRGLRQDRGWTQYELALRVGVHPQAVYLWESGRRTPQVSQIRKLGRVFGMCSDNIQLGRAGDPDLANGASPDPVPTPHEDL